MKSSKDRGIVRIDQPEKYNHGWWVRRRRGKKMHSRFFADKKHGGKNKARVAARAFNDELTETLPPVSRRRGRSSSKVVGTAAQRARRAADARATRLFAKGQKLPQGRRRFTVAK